MKWEVSLNYILMNFITNESKTKFVDFIETQIKTSRKEDEHLHAKFSLSNVTSKFGLHLLITCCTLKYFF